MGLGRGLLLGWLLLAGCQTRGDFVVAYQLPGEKNAREQANDLQFAVFKDAGRSDDKSDMTLAAAADQDAPPRKREGVSQASHDLPARSARVPFPKEETTRPSPPSVDDPKVHWQVTPLHDAVRLKTPTPISQ